MTDVSGVECPSRLGLSCVYACLDATCCNFAIHCCRMDFGVEGNPCIRLGVARRHRVVAMWRLSQCTGCAVAAFLFADKFSKQTMQFDQFCKRESGESSAQ
jgi:hypothetical protein